MAEVKAASFEAEKLKNFAFNIYLRISSIKHQICDAVFSKLLGNVRFKGI